MNASFTNKSNQICRTLFPIIFAAAIFLCVFGLSANAQEATNSNSSSSPTPTATKTPEPSPTPIPLSEVITQAEETTKKLQEIEKNLSANSSNEKINQELPKLKRDLDTLEKETSKPLAGRPSLETLDKIEQDWKLLSTNIPSWKRILQTQATKINKQTDELKKIALIWQATLNTIDENKLAADPSAEVPEEIKDKIKETVNAIRTTQTNVGENRAELLTIQARISEQEDRINKTLENISETRQEALSNLFIKDSPAIWNLQRSDYASESLIQEGTNSLSGQTQALWEYAEQQRDSFFIHGAVFLLLIIGLYWVRKRIRLLARDDPKLKRATIIFNQPIFIAIILTLILSDLFYPQAPRLLFTILKSAALIPGVIILRRLLEKPLFPIFYALVAFYFVGRVIEMLTYLPTISRILFLAEMLGAIVFFSWFLYSIDHSKKAEIRLKGDFTFIKRIVPFALFIFICAFTANVFGFVNLARIIGNGVLDSANIALIFYAALQIVGNLLVFALRVPPFSRLGMVKNHRHLLQRKIFRILRWLALIAWGIVTLNIFSLREQVFTFVINIFTAELSIGSLSISLGSILTFFFTIWLAFLLSRLVRFILQEDVYANVNLADGVPYAISTILHYVLLLLGFFVAIAALGLDLTKFTILAGAFGVGLGFGLQNIVNNFVSGLILLFERPVKVGDMVQMGERQGDLKRIGLRASVMRTLEGAEVIVPNGHLISEEVTNWTLSDSRRRLDIPVGVKYGTDPERVIELLEEVAGKHPEVVHDPAPRTLFLGFGDNSLNFQFRAWTLSHYQWQIVKSELAVGIYKALNEANIEIPFPQRDLHLKSIDKNEFEKLLENQSGKDREEK